jgi:lysophospholipid acyltransferase (LPLAT)-like uncharacterized protein
MVSVIHFPGARQPPGAAIMRRRTPMPLLDRAALWLGPRLASGLIRLLRRLNRWRWVRPEVVVSLHRAQTPYIHAFFHDQLLMMTYSYLGQAYGRRLAVLSSRHRDGEYVSRTLERFGHVIVRGSTGRGGVAGLREMIRHLRAGRDAAFATDGPRGPRHRVQIGVIEASRLGRAPIVPVALGLGKKKTSDRGTRSRCHSRSRAASSLTVTPSMSPPPSTAPAWRPSAASSRRRSFA